MQQQLKQGENRVTALCMGSGNKGSYTFECEILEFLS